MSQEVRIVASHILVWGEVSQATKSDKSNTINSTWQYYNASHLSYREVTHSQRYAGMLQVQKPPFGKWWGREFSLSKSLAKCFIFLK